MNYCMTLIVWCHKLSGILYCISFAKVSLSVSLRMKTISLQVPRRLLATNSQGPLHWSASLSLLSSTVSLHLSPLYPLLIYGIVSRRQYSISDSLYQQSELSQDQIGMSRASFLPQLLPYCVYTVSAHQQFLTCYSIERKYSPHPPAFIYPLSIPATQFAYCDFATWRFMLQLLHTFSTLMDRLKTIYFLGGQTMVVRLTSRQLLYARWVLYVTSQYVTFCRATIDPLISGKSFLAHLFNPYHRLLDNLHSDVAQSSRVLFRSRYKLS